MQDYSNIGLSSNLRSLTGPVSQNNPTGNQLKEYIDNKINDILRPGGLNYTNITAQHREFTVIVSLDGTGGAYKDIQDAIEYVNSIGGGIVFIRAGTYILSSSLSGYSKINLKGEGVGQTIIDFSSGERGLGYVGTSGSRIANFTISNLTIQNSNATAGLNLEFCTDFIIENVRITSCDQKGILFTACQRFSVSNTKSDTNTGNNIEMVGGGALPTDIFFSNVIAESSSAIGFAITTSGSRIENTTFINCMSRLNSGDGFDFASGNYSDIKLIACTSEDNNGHGFDINVGRMTLIGCYADDNSGTGKNDYNIAADSVLIGCDTSSTDTDAFQVSDVGALRVIAIGNTQVSPSSSDADFIHIGDQYVNAIGNMDAPITSEKHFIRMKNTSGATITYGEVVILKSVAAGDEITTTTTAGDNKVIGVAFNTITNNNYGPIQLLGENIWVKVNGTTDIAIGDYLSTFTSAGIAQKAATGHMAFAIALEAYTTDDSNGVIDALLVSPRLI